jgi:DNA-binding protein YbaB
VNDSLQQQLDQAMAEFEQQRQALIQTRETIAAMSVTVRSKDRAVEVTLGSGGEPTSLRFLDNKHKTMSGQALASSVLEAMSVARGELGKRVRAEFDAVAGARTGVAGSGLHRLENLDLDRLLDRAGSGIRNDKSGAGRG